MFRRRIHPWLPLFCAWPKIKSARALWPTFLSGTPIRRPASVPSSQIDVTDEVTFSQPSKSFSFFVFPFFRAPSDISPTAATPHFPPSVSAAHRGRNVPPTFGVRGNWGQSTFIDDSHRFYLRKVL